MSESYSEPVGKLLKVGEPHAKSWTLSVPEGVTRDHADELVRLASDFELFDSGDEPEAYGPVHARRALGLLGVEAAVLPLLNMLSRVDDEDDDWVGEDVPEILARLGPVAIQPVTDYLKTSKNKPWARVAAARALQLIAKSHPDQKPIVVEILADALRSFRANPADVNTFLIIGLEELRAREHAQLVEEVLQSGRVDQTGSDWDETRVHLGLRPKKDVSSRVREDRGWKLGQAIDSVLGGKRSNDPFDDPD